MKVLGLLALIAPAVSAQGLAGLQERWENMGDGVGLAFDLHAPGLCMYYDDPHGRCRYHSTNGIRTSTSGKCPQNLKGTVPTCHGHPDPFSDDASPPQPASQPPIAEPKPVPPTPPPSIAPTPPPTPSHQQVEVDPAGRVIKVIGGNTTEKIVNKPAPAPEVPTQNTRKDKFGGGTLAVLGATIGGCVFAAILVTLSVGMLAYKMKQRRARRAEAGMMGRLSAHASTNPTFTSPKFRSP